MSFALTILLSILSAAIMAGRVFELLNLTDLQTGFLIVNGVVFNPVIIAIFTLIAVCSGIIIFGGLKTVKPYYSKSSRYTAILAGVGLAAAGAVSVTGSKLGIFMIAGGIALVLLGICGLGKKTDILIMALLLVFIVGMSLNIIVFDVYTVYNTRFIQRALEYTSAMLFILAVFKCYYLPSRFSRMYLYVTGMLGFAFCSATNMADIICFAVDGGAFSADLLFNIAFVLLGVYAFDNAVSALPTKKELKQAFEDDAEEQKEESAEEFSAENSVEQLFEQQEETAQYTETAQLENTAQLEETLQIENTVHPEETAQLEKAEQQAVSEEEKPENSGEKSEDDIQNTDVAEDVSKEEDLKQDMFKILFGESGEFATGEEDKPIKDISVRSFKKVTRPKYDQSSEQYDMLKHMFGDGAVPENEAVPCEPQSAEKNVTNEINVSEEKSPADEICAPEQEHSLQMSYAAAEEDAGISDIFDTDEKEAANTEKQTVKTTRGKQAKEKSKFGLFRGKDTKKKSDNKKIVYKKPK